MSDRYIVEHFNVFKQGFEYMPATYLATDPHPEYRLVHYSESRIDDEHYIVQYIWEME